MSLALVLGFAPRTAHADSGLNDGCQVGSFLEDIHIEQVGSLGRKIVITPTNATRLGGGPGSKYLTDELWGTVQDCVPDLYGTTADSVYQQLDCHLYFGADEKGTGPTWDLETSAGRDAVAGRLAELVLKPRTGSGGYGVQMAPEALPADPAGWIAQERTLLSTHPTRVDGVLVPRHVDLRPFVLLGPDGPEVLPAALTRVAFGEGAMVVNSSRDGGAKDTWMMT